MLSSEVLLFLASSVVGTLLARANRCRRQREIASGAATDNGPQASFDVLIVGAGPAGSTAAYFMAKANPKLRIALIDRKRFPRPKPCGDAWCAPGLDILDEMGVLPKMFADGIVQVVKRGGFISPFGYQCINTDGDSYGSATGCRTYAIKRHIADEYLVRAAQGHAGVRLFEEVDVDNAIFDASYGTWTLQIKEGINSAQDFSGKMLLICDGSTSYLAQKLGYLKKGSQPEAVCSHCYVKGDTHKWTSADGVMLFNKATLPGYSALFRHYNNDMYFGTYILPGGQATSRCIAPFEEEAIKAHPYVRDAFGNSYEYAERRVVAPIRMGGIARSYGEQCLIVGDAAGHVDPLTGEGIHTAIVAGKIAGNAVAEMFTKNNFTLAACRAYELRCYDAFGYEFLYSSIAAQVIVKFPICLDAMAVVGQRRGQPFLDFFGEVMTGVKPKSEFLQPGLLAEVSLELVRQFFIQYVLRAPPLMPTDVGAGVVTQQSASGKKGAYA